MDDVVTDTLQDNSIVGREHTGNLSDAFEGK